MRIGVDITHALPPRDGIGHFTAELLRALMLLVAERGDDKLFLYSLSRPLEAAILEEQFGALPDRVHARTSRPWDDGLAVFHCTAGAFPTAFRGPTIFTCYDLTILTHPECHTLDNRLQWITGTLEAHLADATFLTISQASAREIETQLGLASSRIRVIYPAAAPVFRELPAKAARHRLGERFAIAGPFVLAVGTVEPRKNLRRLAAAYAALPAQLKQEYPLVIAGGRGWRFDEDELAREETIRRLGFVERDDLVALYSAATVFAYPSLAEGFGLPVVEAMACGAPVVTSSVSSLPEVAGDAAILADPLDVDDIRRRLQELLENPAERDRLRQRGRERAAVFSWEKTARQTLELYHELGNA